MSRRFLLKLTKPAIGLLVVSIALLLTPAIPIAPTQLKLTLTSAKPYLAVGEEVNVAASITNVGAWPVRLVRPGDGSDFGWRTPMTSWEVIKLPEAEGEQEVSLDLNMNKARCGNINALTMQEIFSLLPSQTEVANDWIYLPPFKSPGKYRVTYTYNNQPNLAWNGIPLGIHNPLAMLLVRHSTSCLLKSNSVIFTVSN